MTSSNGLSWENFWQLQFKSLCLISLCQLQAQANRNKLSHMNTHTHRFWRDLASCNVDWVEPFCMTLPDFFSLLHHGQMLRTGCWLAGWRVIFFWIIPKGGMITSTRYLPQLASSMWKLDLFIQSSWRQPKIRWVTKASIVMSATLCGPHHCLSLLLSFIPNRTK